MHTPKIRPDKLTTFYILHFVEDISSGLPNEIMAINNGVVMVIGLVLVGSLVLSVSRTLWVSDQENTTRTGGCLYSYFFLCFASISQRMLSKK